MKISVVRQWFRVSAAIGLAGAVGAGCAALESEVNPEAVVAQRADARWQALIAGDLQKAYGLLSPTSRKTYTWEIYRGAIRPGTWKSAKVDKVRCPSKDLCEVDVAVEYAYHGAQVRTPIRESWTRQEGEWWYVQKTL